MSEKDYKISNTILALGLCPIGFIVAVFAFIFFGVASVDAMEYDIGYFRGNLWGFTGTNLSIDTYGINNFYSLPSNNLIESVDMDMKQKLPKGKYYGTLNFTLFKSINSTDDSSIGLDQITFYYSLNNYSTITQFQPEFITLNKLNSFYNGTQYQIEYQLVYELDFGSDLYYRIHISSRSLVSNRAWYYITFNPWGWSLTDELPQDTNDVINNSTNTIINNNNSNTNNIINNQNQNQQQTNEKLDNLNTNITDSNVNTDSSASFFQNFENDDHGLSAVITAPLNFIKNLANATCSNLQSEIPLLNTTISLPCMSSKIKGKFPELVSILHTIMYGLVAYYIALDIYRMVKGFKDPESDKIEVVEL